MRKKFVYKLPHGENISRNRSNILSRTATRDFALFASFDVSVSYSQFFFLIIYRQKILEIFGIFFETLSNQKKLDIKRNFRLHMN